MPTAAAARPAPPCARRRFPPEVLTDAEVRALMDACGRGRPTFHRNRAFIAVLYRGGLLVSEALALYPKDLDAASGAVRVLKGKGGRARTIGLDPGAFAVLGVWLDARARLGLSGHSPVFCTARGEAVTSSYVRRLLAGLGARAGIEKRVCKQDGRARGPDVEGGGGCPLHHRLHKHLHHRLHKRLHRATTRADNPCHSLAEDGP